MGAVGGIVSNELREVIDCLLQKGTGVQAKAVGALWTLAREDDSAKRRIADEGGALPGLVACLAQDESPDLQKSTVGILCSLAAANKESTKLIILIEPGVVAGLVKCLFKNGTPVIQANAANALHNLALGKYDSRGLRLVNEEVALRIVNEDRALSSLVNCLAHHDNPHLQTCAARTRWTLAEAKESTKLRVSNEPGVVAGLVKCLLKKGTPDLQANAATALHDLAIRIHDSTALPIVNEEVALRIVNEEGALSGLRTCLAQHDNPHLQTCAARTLGTLAAAKESTKLRVLEVDKSMVVLLKELGRGNNISLQEQAKRALKLLEAPGRGRCSLAIERISSRLFYIIWSAFSAELRAVKLKPKQS